MLSGGAGWQPDIKQMAGEQLGGDGQAPVNQSAGRPEGIRRVSEGYPEGLAGRYGGSAGPGLGWQRRGTGENGGEWFGQAAPPVHLLHDAEEDLRAGSRHDLLARVQRHRGVVDPLAGLEPREGALHAGCTGSAYG